MQRVCDRHHSLQSAHLSRYAGIRHFADPGVDPDVVRVVEVAVPLQLSFVIVGMVAEELYNSF